MDAHQVAKVYVSPKNPQNHHLIPDEYKTKPPLYYILYIQVVRAVQRGCGKPYIDDLPVHDLVPPKSRPPPESFEGIENTSVVKRITPKSNCQLDGIKAWPKLIHEKLECHRFRTPQAVHGINEFVKAIKSGAWTNPRGKNIKLSKKAGTQTVDRSWKERDRTVPKSMQNKKKVKGFSLVWWTMRSMTECGLGFIGTTSTT